MTKRYDEDSLSAYMDGELVPAAIPEIEETIEKEESARAFIIDSVKTAARLRVTMNQMLEEDVPDHLLAVFDQQTAKRSPRKSFYSGIFRLAAAVVILLGGFLAGKLLTPGSNNSLPPLSADLPVPYRQVVDEALENNLSGTPRQWQPLQDAITVTVTPVRTYRHTDGRYYREYSLEVSGGDQPVRINGLAYRVDQGRWTTRALFF